MTAAAAEAAEVAEAAAEAAACKTAAISIAEWAARVERERDSEESA